MARTPFIILILRNSRPAEFATMLLLYTRKKATGSEPASQKGRDRPMFAYVFALLERVKLDRKGVTALDTP